MRHIAKAFTSMTLLLLHVSCAFEFEVNSARTSLEKQVLGTYKEIEDDLILISTQRSASPTASKKVSLPRQVAVDAKQNQDFNRDDVDELKNLGLLGEGKDGALLLLPAAINASSKASPAAHALARTIIAEENRDRSAIWQRIIEANENLSAKDLPQVRRTYAKLQRENATPGQWIEGENGVWQKKSQSP